MENCLCPTEETHPLDGWSSAWCSATARRTFRRGNSSWSSDGVGWGRISTWPSIVHDNHDDGNIDHHTRGKEAKKETTTVYDGGGGIPFPRGNKLPDGALMIRS